MKGTVMPAVVVRLADFGEADRVVTLMTEAHGKLTALARGARKSVRRFGGLTLFSVGEAAVVERPRATLDLLDGFDAGRGLARIALDMAAIAHASYACELVDGLVAPRQSEPLVFARLVAFLTALDGSGAAAPRLRAFELGLLGVLGLAPTLDRCVACARVELDEEGQVLDAAQGGVVCAHCAHASAPSAAPLDGAARAALVLAQAGSEGAAPVPEGVDRACRAALTQLVASQLGHMPRSLTFIAKLNRAR